MTYHVAIIVLSSLWDRRTIPPSPLRPLSHPYLRISFSLSRALSLSLSSNIYLFLNVTLSPSLSIRLHGSSFFPHRPYTALSPPHIRTPCFISRRLQGVPPFVTADLIVRHQAPLQRVRHADEQGGDTLARAVELQRVPRRLERTSALCCDPLCCTVLCDR